MAVVWCVSGRPADGTEHQTHPRWPENKAKHAQGAWGSRRSFAFTIYVTGKLHEEGTRSVRSPPRRPPLLATPIATPLQGGRPERSGLLFLKLLLVTRDAAHHHRPYYYYSASPKKRPLTPRSERDRPGCARDVGGRCHHHLPSGPRPLPPRVWWATGHQGRSPGKSHLRRAHGRPSILHCAAACMLHQYLLLLHE